MTEEQWKAVWQTYQRARELPPHERQGFVRQSAPDQQVVTRVLALLDRPEPDSDQSSTPAPDHTQAETAIAPGDRIGRYTVTGMLGHGGMGDVFSAEDGELHRTVALKVLRPTGRKDEADVAAGFFREARAASALNHPNIVTVYEVTREGPLMAIAMELVSGYSLRHLCGEPQPVAKVVQLGEQIAEALAAAHRAGLVHRDVKPENVMVRADGYVKVLDFGLARQFETGSVTDPSAVPAGTLRYMSPEQIRGQVVDPASDVFALGLVLYELLAGEHAFARSSALETMLAIASSEPAPRSQSSPPLAKLITRMLSKERAGRPSSEQVAEQLRSMEQGAPPAHRVKPERLSWKLAAVTALGAVLALGVWWTLHDRPASVSAPVEAVVFTSEAGAESEAAVSPDGRRIAYVSDQDRGGGIFIKNVDGGMPLPLPGTTASDSFPAWSPDGRSLAFLRRVAIQPLYDLIVKPSAGGPERRVAQVRTVFDTGLTWSPDGRALVLATSEASEQAVALYAINVEDGQRRRLTAPPALAQPFGDRQPQFSPDGKILAFSRRLAFASSKVHLMPINSRLEAAGPAVELRTGKEYTAQPAWLSSSELLVSAGTEHERRLYRMRTSAAATAMILAGAGEFGSAPSVAPAGSAGGATLVYTRRLRASNLFRHSLRLDARGIPQLQAEQPRRLAPSSGLNEHPHLSADGSKVAFVSDRTGSLQIWSVDVATGTETQWTTMTCPTLAVPRWSYDGRQITFTANCDHQTDVYVVAGPGLPPLRLTDSPALDENSTFSPDGQSIYFTSHRENGERIWRVPATGGPAEPVVRQVSSLAVLSDDGAKLYFSGRWQERIAIWSMPVAGGEPRLLLPEISYFVPMRHGILYSPAAGPSIMFFHLATGQRHPLPQMTSFDYVFSAPPDGTSLITTHHDFAATDLMIVRNLR